MRLLFVNLSVVLCCRCLIVVGVIIFMRWIILRMVLVCV